MAELNLYTERKYSTIKLADDKDYKIPNEYTVEEVERLLELRAEQEALETEVVDEEKAQAEVDMFWKVVFSQLEIIFRHYQPEITQKHLKKLITHNEALEILGFFRKYRHLALLEIENETANKKAESKKKVATAKTELRDLRRLIAFMVINGFSLLELRKLYVDEFYDFYAECIYALENSGKVKDGTYAKIKKSNTDREDTVNVLRKQLSKTLANKK